MLTNKDNLYRYVNWWLSYYHKTVWQMKWEVESQAKYTSTKVKQQWQLQALDIKD